MTRPWLRPDANGIYVTEHSALEDQICARVKPPVPARDKWFWLRASGYFSATLLAGLGVLIGMLILCGFAGVFLVVGKLWRAWR